MLVTTDTSCILFRPTPAFDLGQGKIGHVFGRLGGSFIHFTAITFPNLTSVQLTKLFYVPSLHFYHTHPCPSSSPTSTVLKGKVNDPPLSTQTTYKPTQPTIISSTLLRRTITNIHHNA
ncbi:hypothetical protein XPA_007473 [Xanthoria parietina]